jgi:hypothetical protein
MISGFSVHGQEGRERPRPSDSRGLAGSKRTGEKAGPAYAWAEAFHSLRGEPVGDLGERESDRERIACLEAIIATLIEKNERMRQQLTNSLK